MTDVVRQPDLGTKRPTERRCKATTKHGENAGKRCGRYAIPGGEVCVKHGGAAPQTRAKAQERLDQLRYPAIVELQKILLRKDTSDRDKLKAILMVLDRTGLRAGIDISADTESWAHLYELIAGGTAPAGETGDNPQRALPATAHLPAAIGGSSLPVEAFPPSEHGAETRIRASLEQQQPGRRAG